MPKARLARLNKAEEFCSARKLRGIFVCWDNWACVDCGAFIVQVSPKMRVMQNGQIKNCANDIVSRLSLQQLFVFSLLTLPSAPSPRCHHQPPLTILKKFNFDTIGLSNDI